jgi:hypothetical protein
MAQTDETVVPADPTVSSAHEPAAPAVGVMMPDPPGPAMKPADDGSSVSSGPLDPYVPTIGMAGTVPDAVEPALDVVQRFAQGFRMTRMSACGMSGREAEHDDDGDEH